MSDGRPHITQEPLIPMTEVVRRFLAAGWSQKEIAEALARTWGGEDELAVVEDIVARRGE